MKSNEKCKSKKEEREAERERERRGSKASSELSSPGKRAHRRDKAGRGCSRMDERMDFPRLVAAESAGKRSRTFFTSYFTPNSFFSPLQCVSNNIPGTETWHGIFHEDHERAQFISFRGKSI